MTNPTYRTFLGIAKEATKGTGVAATAYIPIKRISPVDDIKELNDQGWRGSAVTDYDAITGVTGATFGFGGDVLPDTIGWPIMGILGDYAITGAGAPYTHTGAVKNTGDQQPTAYSLTDFDAVNARQYAGFQFDEVTLKFNADGMLEYDAKGESYASAVVSTPTSSFGTIPPLASWVGVATIAGSAASNTLDGTLTLKRKLTRIYGMQGSQNPFRVWVGPLTVNGKLSFTMEDDTQLTHYLTNDKPSLDLNWSQGASAALVQVKFHMTKVAYSKATIDRGNDFVKLSCDFTALANTTDVGATVGYSPVKATIQNAVSTAVYG